MPKQKKYPKGRRPLERSSSKKAVKSISFNFPRAGSLKLGFYKETRGRSVTRLNFILEIQSHKRAKTRAGSITRQRHYRGRDIYYPELVWNWLKSKPQFILIAVGVLGVFYFSTHLQKPAHFNIIHPSAKALAAPPVGAVKFMPASIPVELKIPKIDLDTKLEQTGLDANGAITMPWDIEEADWYKYSPSPGQVGPSIIVGHLDGGSYANMTGVFYKLNQLASGDEIIVIRADGTTATFKVIGLKQVSQSNFPTAEVYGNIDYAGIRLITCGGTFDQSVNHYTDNTVVYGALE